VCGHGWLAVGDAAMAFDPLSSQGLLQALASGIRAGETAVRHLAGESTAVGEYALKTAEIFGEYKRLHAVYYGREGRWPQSIFWQRRSAAVSAVGGGRLSFLTDRKSVDGRR
jgi:flavin-dependent dehydrogenase